MQRRQLGIHVFVEAGLGDGGIGKVPDRPRNGFALENMQGGDDRGTAAQGGRLIERRQCVALETVDGFDRKTRIRALSLGCHLAQDVGKP
jgi:hypothetical protein